MLFPNAVLYIFSTVLKSVHFIVVVVVVFVNYVIELYHLCSQCYHAFRTCIRFFASGILFASSMLLGRSALIVFAPAICYAYCGYCWSCFKFDYFVSNSTIRSSNSFIRFALPGLPGASNKLSNIADWEVLRDRLRAWTNAISRQQNSANLK